MSKRVRVEGYTVKNYKCLLKYYGSKYQLSNKINEIIETIPHVTYCETHGGSAAVLLRKAPSKIEVYNDLDGQVVNFFRVLRNHTEELHRLVMLTPWSREEKNLAYEFVYEHGNIESVGAIEAARLFYVNCHQSFNPGKEGHGSWSFFKDNTDNRKKASKSVGLWQNQDILFDTAKRLKKVQMDNDTATKVIERFDTPKTLFYCDPPYLPETRVQKDAYLHEMTKQNHIDLAQVLNRIEGMAILSGYRSELYNELYKEWQAIEVKSKTNCGAMKVEVIWVSPRAADVNNLPLFQLGNLE